MGKCPGGAQGSTPEDFSAAQGRVFSPFPTSFPTCITINPQVFQPISHSG